MTKKVRCTVTGNIVYLTEKRYAKVLAKYGSEENLATNYISMVGKKIQEGSLDHPPKAKNRIQCTVSGRFCVITNQRIDAGIKKYGSWEELCNHYTCRPAARLLREGKTVDEIKQMVMDGSFPEK